VGRATATIFLLVTLPVTTVVAGRQRPAFQSASRTVMVHATVRANSGRLVPDLPREAFQVFDGGRPADVTFFSNDPQTLTVALLIDMSGSMDRHYLRVRAATGEFVKALKPGDRVRVGTFGEEVALSPHLTGDKRLLTRVLEEEVWPGGGTPMWRATYEAMDSLEKEPGRRVLLILTDGADADPLRTHTADAVGERAVRDGFMVYGIGLEGTGLDTGVRVMADETGGGSFELKAGDDLASTFTRVVEELRHQYVLGFTPAVLDGRTHRIEVKLTSSGLKARARRNYVATPDGVR
jgi:Ca-activated chloride channel family protein